MILALSTRPVTSFDEPWMLLIVSPAYAYANEPTRRNRDAKIERKNIIHIDSHNVAYLDSLKNR